MQKNMNKKGFTIVELVIVIAVIAILAAVLIPTFISLVNKANLSADQQAVTQMNTVLSAESGIDSLEKAINALEAGGYNAADTLIPVSKNHAFYWYKTHNIVILVKEEANAAPSLVWPEDEKYSANFAVDFAKTGDTQVIFSLKGGAKYIDVTAKDSTTLSNALTLGTKDITVTEDITFIQPGIVTEGSKVSLDLGGKNLVTTTKDPAGNHHYAIDAKGDITVSNGTVDARGVHVYEGAKVTVEAGTTINAVDKNGGACLWLYGGEAVINGAKLTALNGDCTTDYTESEPGVIYNDGKVTIFDATVESKSGVYAIVNNGELVIDNGDFTASRGIVACNKGTAEINGGVFTVTDNMSGWCVYATGDAQVVINAGTFSGTNVFTCAPTSEDYNGASITIKAGVVVNGKTLTADVVLNSTNRTLK